MDFGESGLALAMTTRTPEDPRNLPAFVAQRAAYGYELLTDTDTLNVNVLVVEDRLVWRVFRGAATACEGPAGYASGWVTAVIDRDCLSGASQASAAAFAVANDGTRTWTDQDPPYPNYAGPVQRHSGPAVLPVGGSSSPPPTASTLFDGDAATTERVGEATPIAAAAAIAHLRFPAPGSASHAVISRVDQFADSLAGAPLTATGPLLFTHSAALPTETSAQLQRLFPGGGTVYLLGGPDAVTPAVEQQLQSLGHRVRRLAGATRVETSVAVAEEVRALHPGRAAELAIARAYGPPDNPTAAWADSVSGGAWATHHPTALVLTPTDQLHPAVSRLLQGVTTTWVFGGEAAIAPEVAALLPNAHRVAGPERAATAVAASTLYGATSRYVVVNGYADDGWAYGLAAAGVSRDASAPLLYAAADPPLPPATRQALATPCGVAPRIDTLLVGPLDRLSNGLLAEIDAIDGGPC